METTETFNWQRLLITAVIVLVAAGVTAGTTYYVLNQNFQKEREANEKALSEVQTQLKKVTAPATTTTTPAVTSPTTANSGTVIRMPEFGIQFTADSNISDLTYSYNSQSKIASVSTRALTSTGGNSCSASSAPLGTITVTTQAPLKAGDPNLTPANGEGAFVKQVGSKYIYYMHAMSVCSENQTATAIQTSASQHLKASLLTAELIK